MNVLKSAAQKADPAQPKPAVRTWWVIWVRVWLLGVIELGRASVEPGRGQSRQRWGRQTSLSYMTQCNSYKVWKWSTRCFHVIHFLRNTDKTKLGKFPFLQRDVHPLVWSPVYWCCVTLLQSCKCQKWMLKTLKNKGNGSPTHDFCIMTKISGTDWVSGAM